MKDHRLSTQLLGPPINEQRLPFGSNAIKPDDTPVYREPGCAGWIAAMMLGAVLLGGIVNALKPVGVHRGQTETANHAGYAR